MPLHDLRVGLVGAGGISHEHAQAWLALGAQLFAYSPSGAASLVETYGIRAATSLDELVEWCDVVDICSPTETHPQLILAGIAAGKPVICEKPLALTGALAAALASSAAEAGVSLYPAHVLRFFPEYARAKEAVDAGAVGTVAVSRFTRRGEYPSWSPWFADESKSGGIVLDQMIHDLDMALWISGAVVRVYAVRSKPVAQSSVVSAQVVLTHSTGAISYVTGVWGAAGTKFSTSFSIAGARGVIEHDTRKDATVQLDIAKTVDHATTRPDISAVESPFFAELREFVLGLRGELEPRVTAADGVMAVRVARAAIESIDSGVPVEFTQIEEVTE
jgi:myo-inositol 2-dehydrogenase/D-chiro-inositol 1-dehydrogenase